MCIQNIFTGLSSLGAASSYSDMAVSYEQWVPVTESALNYYTGHPGPSFAAAYNVPMTPDYSAQQQVSGFLETVSQYVSKMFSLCTFFQHTNLVCKFINPAWL